MKTSPENLKPLIHCPVCNRKYKPAKAVVLEEQDNHTVLHLTCGECRVSSVVFVSTSQWGVVSMGSLTDLEESEARSLFQDDAVSTDQVIEVHNFLKSFKGGVNDFISN